MKYIVLFLLFFSAFGFSSFAQKYNPELLKSYSKKELQSIDAESIEVLNFAVENATYFTPITENKNDQLQEIDLSNQQVKFTDLGLKILDKTQYFRVKGTNQMLVVKSVNILKLQMKKSK